MQFYDNFLAEVGMNNLPDNEKQAFMSHVQEELEVRVGEKMIQGLTNEQVHEFEGIMDNDQMVIRKVVAELGRDFRQDEIYKKILEKHGVTEGTWEIIVEYLSIKWIQKNRPDYKDVFNATVEELKREIIAGNQVSAQPVVA